MIEINEAKQFRFRVVETRLDWQRFTVLQPLGKDVFQLAEEAARIYYYGMAGWQEAWPLTFELETLKGNHLIKAAVFILTAQPDFDVIELKPPQTPLILKAAPVKPEKETSKTWETVVATFAITALLSFLLEALSHS